MYSFLQHWRLVLQLFFQFSHRNKMLPWNLKGSTFQGQNVCIYVVVLLQDMFRFHIKPIVTFNGLSDSFSNHAHPWKCLRTCFCSLRREPIGSFKIESTHEKTISEIFTKHLCSFHNAQAFSRACNCVRVHIAYFQYFCNIISSRRSVKVVCQSLGWVCCIAVVWAAIRILFFIPAFRTWR